MTGLFWKQMPERSGETVDWLAANGVAFTGKVDNYSPDGQFPTFHWFPGDHEAQTYYGDPMEATFRSHEGCDLRFKTRGRALKFVDGQVADVYATADDGVLEVNAPVVILATGGFGGSDKEVAKRYNKLPVGRYFCDGALTNCGDGTNMVISAGGVDAYARNACFLGACTDTTNGAFMFTAVNGNTAWVNQDGVRFVDESVGGLLSIPGINQLFQQPEIYALLEIAVSYGMPAALGDIASNDYTRLTDMMGDGFKEVYLRATDREVMQMVASGRTELGTVFAFEEDIAEFDDLEGHLLYSRPLFVMAHRDHPLAAFKALEMNDLRDVPFALGTQNSSCQGAFKEACRAHGFDLNVVFEDDDMEYANQLVEQNRCARLVCRMDAREVKPPLTLLPFSDPKMRWQVYMIHQRSTALSDQAKRYLRMGMAFAAYFPRV